MKLFERTRHQVALTMAGEVLLQDLPGLFSRLSDIVDRTRTAGGEVRIPLRIGYSAMSFNTPMSSIVNRYRRVHPDAEITLVEQTSSSAIRALRAAELDCVFLPNPQTGPDIGTALICNEPLLCCMPADTPLAGLTHIDVQDLRHANLILPSPGSRFGEYIATALNTHSVPHQVVARISRPSVFLTLISAGKGITFMPLSMKGMIPEDLVCRPFGNPTMSMPFCLAWIRDRRSAELEHLLEIVGAVCGDQSFVSSPGSPEAPLQSGVGSER